MGIFSDQDYFSAIENKLLSNVLEAPKQIQANSIDLTISNKIYRVQSSFLPSASTVSDKLSTITMYDFNLSDSFVLEKGCIYIIPLNEKLALSKDIDAFCNPKSSTGRLDIFTRVISDYATAFDKINSAYCGQLYLEIMPRSFSVRIHPRQALVQLRLRQGSSLLSSAELYQFYLKQCLLFDETSLPIKLAAEKMSEGLPMSLSLENKESIAAYKAKRNSHVIDLNKLAYYKINDYWEIIPSCKQLILEPEEFYIFRSKERIKIPSEICGDMNAYDVSLGELRTHYAGFFDSGFGVNNGAHIVLEVRSHDIPFLVEDSQKIFNVQFHKNLSNPSRLYGTELNSNYQHQKLKLAKQFT